MMDQKESENISDNLRWSIDMRMRTGKYNALLRYTWDREGARSLTEALFP